MRKVLLLIPLIVIALLPHLVSAQTYQPMLVAQDTLLAFPGAEGFGKYASGGRGGQVVYVTTLADDSVGAIPGSLRWAVQQYPGQPLTVLFAVTGEIRLKKDLRLNRKNFTIAGQSAPGVGVVITHNKVNLGGSENFIMRNLRFRIGRNDVKGNIITQNAFGAENCSNYIIDHCEFGWSTEENMNTYDSHFITVQYCIVHEGLNNSGHPKGARGYGCQWGGSPATYHHNLLVNNEKRSCRFNGAQSNDYVVYLDYINNVVYNYYGGSNGCYGGENTANLAAGEYNGLNSAHECNFVNNYYKKGPNSSKTVYFFQADYARSGATSWGPSQWYLSGNVMDGKDALTQNNWSGVSPKTYTADQLKVDTLIRPNTPWWRWTTDSVYGRYNFDLYAYAAAGTYETAVNGFNTVLDTAGCFPRDHVSNRLVSDTRAGTYSYSGSVTKKKGIIDLETDAEGFYDYTVVAPFADTDQDGMPDFWETMYGMNPAVADQNVRDAVSGYSMLEVYLDWAMHNKSPMDDGYGQTTGLNHTTSAPLQSSKILRDGHMVILHGGKEYLPEGRQIK